MALFIGHFFGYGQLNKYKYIIVPTKFQDFKNENQFRTSTLVKYLFTSEGFNTVYSNNLPEDLEQNICLGLRVQLIDGSGLLITKARLSLTDCNGVLIMTSQEGRTKTKAMEQAYREAISEAFGSFRGLNYSYEPENGKDTETVTVSFKNDVKSLESESEALNEKETVVEISTEPEKEKPLDKPGNKKSTSSKSKGVLYAQPIEGGYQLVDTTPQVVYVLKATSSPDVFLVNKDGKNGVVFKDDDKWFIEMDEKGGKARELNIKF